MKGNRLLQSLMFVLFMIISSGCGTRQLETMEYIRFIEDEANGLCRSVKVGDINYIFQYKPVAYVVAKESRNSSVDEQQKRQAELAGTVWFNIKLENLASNTSLLRAGIHSSAEYQARYDYFVGQAANDIKLIYKGQELKPISYSFENNYNLTPMETMVVGFALPDNGNIDDGIQIAFFDRIFKNGIVKSSYSKRLITNIPECIL